MSKSKMDKLMEINLNAMVVVLIVGFWTGIGYITYHLITRSF